MRASSIAVALAFLTSAAACGGPQPEPAPPVPPDFGAQAAQNGSHLNQLLRIELHIRDFHGRGAP